MTALLEALRRKEVAIRDAAEEAYEALVRKSWDGGDVDPEQAMKVLAEAGRTVEDLESDCRALDVRAECQKLANEIPALQARMDANRATLQAARESLTAAEKEFAELSRSIEVDNDKVIRRLRECDDAAGKLRNDPELRDESNWRDRQRITRQRSALGDALRDAEAAARPEQVAADRGNEEKRLEDELRAAIQRPQHAKRSAEAVRSELAGLPGKYSARLERRDELRGKYAELEKQEKELEAQAIAG